MKWKLTGKFLTAVVIAVVFVFITNVMVIFGLYLVQGFSQGQAPLSQTDAERMTRDFHKQLSIVNNQVTITEQGKNRLNNHQAWIQVLNDRGEHIYSYLAPNSLPKKYTPIQIVQIYKYYEIDGDTTILIGEERANNQSYSYLIGFRDPDLRKKVWIYDKQELLQLFQLGGIFVLAIDVIIALIIGYFYSTRLTKPLKKLMEAIKQLANKKYPATHEEKGIYRDVFQHVNELSLELQSNERERKKLDIMKEEWISNISHDMKTPLASIQGYAELMKNDEYQFTVEEMQEYADIIEQKSLYLKDVIEDLNLSTRLKNKKLSLHLARTNIVSLIRTIVIDILNDPKYSGRHIDFQFEKEPIYADVDELLIRRAINNLIYNALVHNSPDVHIIVNIMQDEQTHIRIQDNGQGIQKGELEKIVDRYYRGTNTGERHKGSGLGLAIANDIIKTHNGKLTFESEPRRGTTVEVEF
ncbi:HAMP domain-containing histidine kinase [Paenibacillus sp. SC116]|uniref:sensor histidine kinase n=1 Tax=Paenibacillus sp. SC116 TaxID=2968986 RepID=UPI00215AF631|nr:HAMP domain-containing sensor histidine kinase [Paenibacillus sp. SC116]MCR8845893.1 HAMP domain-containing histidine kinase [Paenibacillus sp. SC116]